jgi:histone H3/H4
MRWQSQAIQALQEASEAFLVHLFEDTKYVTGEQDIFLPWTVVKPLLD